VVHAGGPVADGSTSETVEVQQAYARSVILLRLVWVLLVGVPVALILFTLAALFWVTIIGIPVALVLLVLGRNVLRAPF
jgi:uncharacterized membrane protein YccF (DUF307 family)